MSSVETKIQELRDEIRSKATQKWIRSFLEKEKDFTGDDIQKLRDIIYKAQTIYNYSGEDPGMDDTLYDKLYEKLDALEDGALMTVPIVGKNKNIVYHKFPSLRGTLDKIYFLRPEDKKDVANKSRRGLPDWIQTCERKIYEKTGKKVDLTKELIYVFPKWDGVSCIFEFLSDGTLNRALTRGYTETNEAQDITHIFKSWVKGPVNPMGNEYGFKTEIMMKESDFEMYNLIYNTNFKNSRSIVSSILNSDEVDDRVKYLQIQKLRTSLIVGGEESAQVLVPNVFDTPYLKCHLGDIDKIEKFAKEHKYTNDLRCDGAVIYLINPEIQKILGRENNKQKFEVAYKFTEEVGYTKVKDVIFQVGLFGRLAPVVCVKPVKLKGNTIEKISLGSYQRFKSLKLREGDTIKVLYDIIPYALYDENDPKCKRSKNKIIKAPEVCPECGEPLEIKDDQANLQCDNPKCPCRKKGKILNYLQKLNVDGISYATIDTLYDAGLLKHIPDLYKLEDKRKQLEKIPGFGKNSVRQMIDSINKIRVISQDALLGSIGIEGFSLKSAATLLTHINYDDLLELCWNDKHHAQAVIAGISGFGEKKADMIVEGLRANEKLILKLEDMITITPFEKAKPKFTVCFTKVRDADLEALIVKMGGAVSDQLTKDTSFLVVPVKGISSAKVTKAEKYNIPIVILDNVENYLNEHFG